MHKQSKSAARAAGGAARLEREGIEGLKAGLGSIDLPRLDNNKIEETAHG